MRLAVSNIAWGSEDFEGLLHLLGVLKCDGIELAPSLIWDEPVHASVSQRNALCRTLQDSGLAMAGLHSLYYTRPDLKLFEDEQARRRMEAYTRELMYLCRDLGGRILVFGSPGNRRRGEMPLEQAIDIAIEFLSALAETAQKCEVFLCIEPLSGEESDFITSSLQGLDLVARVNHPNIRLHLDAKSLILSQEASGKTIPVCFPYLKHFHVGDPQLAPPGSSGADHSALGIALRSTGYDGFVSVEMRRGFGPPAEVIEQSVSYVRRYYLDEATV